MQFHLVVFRFLGRYNGRFFSKENFSCMKFKQKNKVLFVYLFSARRGVCSTFCYASISPNRQTLPFFYAALKMDPNDEQLTAKTKAFRLAFRLSEKEKSELQARADRVGTGLSNYARQKLLAGKTIAMNSEEQAQLKGMAINLNQIARKVNATGQVPGELTELLVAINQILSDAYGQR
jgi:hypothetical protein